jgi:tetratricopeptide (TPR) repeat protein
MDYHPDDIENIIAHLRRMKSRMTQQDHEATHRFHSFMKDWDKISEDLWRLGYWDEYYSCANVVLECAKQINQNAVIAQVLNEIGWREMEKSDLRSAKQRFTQALKKYRETPDGIVGQCRTLRYLGTLYHRQRLFGSALNCYRKALKLSYENQSLVKEIRQIDSERAEIHNLMGNLYLKLNDFNRSKSELINSLKGYVLLHQMFNQELGDFYLYFQAAPILNLGRLHFQLGEFKLARKYYNECISLCQKIRRLDMEAGASIRLAELEEVEGNKPEAFRLTERAKKLTKKEAPTTHAHARQVSDTIQGKRKSFILVQLNRIPQLFVGLLDLLIFAPATAWRYVKNSLKRHRRF